MKRKILITISALLGIFAVWFIFMFIWNSPMVVGIRSAAADEKLAVLDMSGFDTVDTNSSRVTSNIFAQYDITMVNIWTTTCSPCIAEMPMLGEMYKSFPENANLISVCLDAEKEKDIEFARQVVTDAGCGFSTLLPDESIKSSLKSVYAFPTTVFIGSDGKIVGEPVVGALSEDEYTALLNKAIETISEKQ